MYSTYREPRGFDHLETANKIIDSWPTWKKELAGIACSIESTPKKDDMLTLQSCSLSDIKLNK